MIAACAKALGVRLLQFNSDNPTKILFILDTDPAFPERLVRGDYTVNAWTLAVAVREVFDTIRSLRSCR